MKRRAHKPRKQPEAGGPAQPAGGRRTAWPVLFGIDPRSLALFRILLGTLLLADLVIRAGDMAAMYTDDGMFSRAEICRRVTSVWNWSFHFGGGSWGFQALLFGLAAGLALALLLGWETRLATIGSWLMLVSLHHRVPPVISGAEILLRLLLMWGMFLPLGRAWSVDAWQGRRRAGAATPNAPTPVLSVASAAILLQMALMYLFSALFKSNPVWFRGEAIEGVMAHDFYASRLGPHLLQFPGMLAGMTWTTFVLEWAAPLLLFVPWRTARLRMMLVAALAAMHLGIAAALEVGLFSFVAIAGLTLFLPAEFWNSRLLARLPGAAGPVPPAGPGAHGRPNDIVEGVAAALLLYMLAVNVAGLPSRPLGSLAPDRWRPLTMGAALGQKWNMFEDVPSRDGWYVARAKLKDGSEVDLLRQGAALDWTRPAFPAGLYRNHYWQKLFREMAYDDDFGYQHYRAPVADYLCREWNARNAPERQVAEFELAYCTEEPSGGTGTPGSRTTRELLARLDFRDP